MTNNNLPKTATISYFDVETGQNLTAEEWNQLHPITNSDKITIINKSGGDFISEKDGYGPCTVPIYTSVIGSDGNYTIISAGPISLVRFHLMVECYNWCGGGGTFYAENSRDALRYVGRLEEGCHPQVSSEVERKCAALIREAVQKHSRGTKVDGYIKVKGNFWGGCEWSYKY